MILYDAYGRLVDTARLRDEQAAPTMTGVRNIYSVMHPSVGLTPEKLAAVLRQAEFGDPYLYLELAEEMEEKDLHYLAVLGTRKQTIAGLQISVRPASGEAAPTATARTDSPDRAVVVTTSGGLRVIAALAPTDRTARPEAMVVTSSRTLPGISAPAATGRMA